jgi:hypothetical protein
MRLRTSIQAALSTALITLGCAAVASASPTFANPTQAAISSRGPVGWQSYRRLDLLPLLREGVSTYQASSADPTGQNDDGFSGRYSCVHRIRLGCVMAQHTGPGELESVWTAGNQMAQPGASGRLMIQLDGRTVVDQTWPQLTSGQPVSPFAFPLALAPNESWGGSSIQVPMTFRHSMRVISQFNPHYFHVVYRTFQTGADLQRGGAATKDPPDVLSELRDAGTRDPKPSMGPNSEISRGFHLAPGRSAVIARIQGAGAITQLRLAFTRYVATARVPAGTASADVYEHARLRISFDGRVTVDAPVGEFFGSGLGPARVRSLMFAMTGGPTGSATTWWPMPFARSAVVELVNDSSTTIASGQSGVTWVRDPAWVRRLGPTGRDGYFHAFSHAGMTTPGDYWTFVSTRGSGTFVGVTLTIEGGTPPTYMEGNERAYVDGAPRPQIQGTGTEDFFDGGWYFWNNPFTLPLTGYAMQQTSADGCPFATCKTMYRVMIADAVPYTRSILYEIQHGPENNIQAHYSSTAYYYQRRTG